MHLPCCQAHYPSSLCRTLPIAFGNQKSVVGSVDLAGNANIQIAMDPRKKKKMKLPVNAVGDVRFRNCSFHVVDWFVKVEPS